MTHRVIGYVFDPEDYQALRQINKALFGDGSHMTADQRRDLANVLHLLLNKAEEMQEMQPTENTSD